MVSEQKAVSEQ